MIVEHVPPAEVPELGRLLRRSDDVGKHHRGQNAMRLVVVARPGEKLLDLVQQGIAVSEERKLSPPSSGMKLSAGMASAN